MATVRANYLFCPSVKDSCRLIVAIAICGVVTPLLAGSPTAQPVEGSVPLSNNPAATAPTDVAGLQTVPQQATAGAPGSGSKYFSPPPERTERGVAGSGLPREKVTEVDTKKLTSIKTDGKFSTGLLDTDIKNVATVKSRPKNDNVGSKGGGKDQKPIQAGEKASVDSTKAATANKADGNH